MRRSSFALLSLPLLLSLAACGGLTQEEAAEALEEAAMASEASALTSGSIEISTNFTIGDAAAVAADELRNFYETTLPCASVTLANATLTIVYGDSGVCIYKGQTYSGTHEVTVMANTMAQVLVHHEWTDLANQTVSVTGTADVTWDGSAGTRTVEHTTTWTRLSDGRQGVGTGSRTFAALELGILDGFTYDGTRTWSGESGEWLLLIDDVEMRWADAVPQAGAYILDTPFNKTLSISFARDTDTRIVVTISNGGKSYDFGVTTLP